MRRFEKSTACILLTLLTAACAGTPVADLPTLMVLPTQPPAIASPERPTLPPTWTLTFTPTLTPTPTLTLTSSSTFTPSITPTFTDTPTSTATPTPMGDARISGADGANLRRGPGTRFEPVIKLLPPETELILAGRTSDGRWFDVRTFDGFAGWVFAELVEPRRQVTNLNITWIDTPTPAPPPVIIGNPVVNVGVGVVGAPGISERARQIFLQGQAYGNRANAFSKVGDSITANQSFFLGFDSGAYELGPYSYLQDTVNFFSGSFGRSSYAAASAFNAAAVLDAIWADPGACMPNETPLDCEYRVHRPSIAIIMLGSVDVQLYDIHTYRTYMNIIVDATISKAIVPVLTTFPNGPNYYPQNGVEYNAAIREIAAREQIPVIELRDPAMALPNSGVLEDQFHLSQRGDGYISFNGDERQWALTLRDLLTLQMLDAIRRSVIG